MLSLLRFFIGLLTGFMSGLLGVGGGFILVPLLITIGITTKVAIGSSLAYIALTSFSGFVIHRRQGTCNLMLAMTALSGGIFTAQLGAQLTIYAEARTLEILLGIILLGCSIIFFRKGSATIQAHSSNTFAHCSAHHARVRIYVASLMVGSLIGFLTGLFGVGGGFLFVPLMVMILHIPIHICVGTSLLYMVGTSVSGTMRHLVLGQIDPLLVLILAIGGVIGAPIGAKSAKKLSPRTLTNMFVTVLLVFGIKLLIG